MKKQLITAIVVGACLVGTLSQAESKTPVTETTYSTLEIGCSNACLAGARKIYEEPGAKAYCLCTCGQLTLNARHVVQAYALKYEEDVAIHLSEVMPNYTQILACRSSSGLKELLKP